MDVRRRRYVLTAQTPAFSLASDRFSFFFVILVQFQPLLRGGNHTSLILSIIILSIINVYVQWALNKCRKLFLSTRSGLRVYTLNNEYI